MAVNDHTPIKEYYEEAHAKLWAMRQSSEVLREVENAKKLEEFFSGLKKAILSGGDINDPIYQTIIDEMFATDYGKKTFMKKSGRVGGFKFEQEIAKIIAAVTNLAGDGATKKIKSNDLVVGNVTGRTQYMENVADDLTDKFSEELGKEVKNEIDKRSKRNIAKQASVQAKTDIKGFDIGIEVEDQGIGAIYNLLKDATFSAKNYGTQGWDKTLKMTKEKTHDIHLGSSDWYRSISGALHYLMEDSQEKIDSEIFAAVTKEGELRKNINRDTREHLYHLKTLYEITGAGIVYSTGESHGIAKYLIYNDPSTDNIFCISTRAWVLYMIAKGVSGDQIKKNISIARSDFTQDYGEFMKRAVNMP